MRIDTSYWTIRLPSSGRMVMLRGAEPLWTCLCADCQSCFRPDVVSYPIQVVTSETPIHLRRYVEQIARYFRREFGYDFVQYDCGEKCPTTHAYLWENREGVFFGACCFRWREYKDVSPRWAMQWIWMHPYFRRHGHLIKAWPYFCERFGEFWLEYPLSDAMRSFADKNAPWIAQAIREMKETSVSQ